MKNKELSEMDENTVILRCKQGEMSAYKMIYDRYEQPLLHTAFRMLRQQEDAEDAVQTTFLKLYRGIQNYQLGGKFSTYLFQILMNVCFDMLRKKNRAVMSDRDPEELAVNPQPSNRLAIEKAINSLPDRMRACFVLFAVEEFKQKEIAEILNLSVGGVKSSIFHAKAHLRSLLSDSLGLEAS